MSRHGVALCDAGIRNVRYPLWVPSRNAGDGGNDVARTPDAGVGFITILSRLCLAGVRRWQRRCCVAI